MATAAQVTPDTPVTIKVTLDGVARRFKFPLRDVGINVLESKLRTALGMPADSEALIERYSDSAAAYVVLDQTNTVVYKQLYRAAKAKHKLKLRVTTIKQDEPEEDKGPKPASVADEPEEESHPSVEPTETERESEQATIAASEEKPSVEPMPALVAELSPPAPPTTRFHSPVHAPPPPLADISPRSAPVAAMGCPVMRANYAVCCNSCDRTIPESHYHCSTCDDGDFDLCQDCVDRGVTCKGTNHWLIKRFVKNGVIINSTTERLAPKPRPKAQTTQSPIPAPVPVASERIIPVFNDLLFTNIRTCNCCVSELPAADFVHCTTCEDYDLCRQCFARNNHGHHPKHAFVAAVEGTKLEPDVARRLTAGRGQLHNAICDGCDNGIRGIRHKCLDCPDWDYCSDCVVNASFIHPGHRFAPIYEPLEYNRGARLRSMNRPVHVGICCDGPLCSSARTNTSYIVGDRFKCAVCHDTDFCASCEASPANNHNRTHPLIKFKTPVRHVSVTTTGENVNGRPIPTMGDRPRPRPAAASPAPAPAPAQAPAPAPAPVTARAPESSSLVSLISDVQTVVDVKPSEPVKVEEKVEKTGPKPLPAAKLAAADDLVATYVRDTVQDGTVLGPDHVFEQTWVLRNEGKVAWPAGCSVRFVGGDYMGHLDSNHPAATKDVEVSCESTICYASIQPGEEFPFTVLLRTPHRPGRVVSNWRLTTKDGHKFGHRLWCDIVVEKPKVVLPPVTVVEPVKQEEKQPEVKKEDEEVAVKSEPEVEAEPQHSQMIFPKLEKESPVASVHEEEAKAERTAALAQEDEYEDCEWNEEDDEEGFLTDEEYDVLDASDEESLDAHSKQK